MTISDAGTLATVSAALSEMLDSGISRTTYRLLRKVLVRECGMETVNCVDDFVFERGLLFEIKTPVDEIIQTCRI